MLQFLDITMQMLTMSVYFSGDKTKRNTKQRAIETINAKW